jgi:hypothetical protein
MGMDVSAQTFRPQIAQICTDQKGAEMLKRVRSATLLTEAFFNPHLTARHPQTDFPQSCVYLSEKSARVVG